MVTGRGPSEKKPRLGKKWAFYPRMWMPFSEARGFVHDLGLKGKAEWGAYCRGDLARGKGLKPENIPASPERVYPSRWQGWGDWLGTGTIAPKNRRYRPFGEARSFARALNFGGSAEWFRWSRGELPEKGKRPLDIPSAPWLVYRNDGWRDMGDWLGTGTVAPVNRSFRPFKEARAWARLLKLKSSTEWASFSVGRMPEKGRRPDDIPSNPSQKYRGKGWKGYKDWLGNTRKRPRSTGG